MIYTHAQLSLKCIQIITHVKLSFKRVQSHVNSHIQNCHSQLQGSCTCLTNMYVCTAILQMMTHDVHALQKCTNDILYLQQ